ncbi:MAG: tripartite tricarboxylate transporter substrate binding protein [Candidatus Vecturithrix sp.]|jgi:tripartite-type tricarboxylate transporter receptor subunit TctC|nr:tripartite tricarboxylate transporter substrate binding protein [Candidatus Vecturithrix sp.]
MKNIRLIAVMIVVSLVVLAGGLLQEAAAQWKPEKPINLIVPWGAGGSTDSSARINAGIIEEALGQKIVIVNQPGASGSVGTKSCLDAERDGYTWTAGAAKDLGNYKIQGLLDTVIQDWHLFLNVAMPQVVSVNADAPYQTFDDLLAAFKEKPGQIAVATAGINSAGHTAIEQIKKYAGIEYKHVTYDGGNPAVIAVVSGEAEVVPQLSVEEVDMLRAGKLRALAVLASEPLEIDGYGTIPPITQWLPEFETAPIYFGIFIPKGVPDDVISGLGEIWDTVVKPSPELKKFAGENAVVVDPAWGEEAQAKAFPMIQLDAWLKYDTGQAKISPEEVGIPRPE